MSVKRKAELKDAILNIVNSSNGSKPEDIAKDHNTDSHSIRYLSEELAEDGLINLLDVANRDSGATRYYRLMPTNKGKAFLSLDVGFVKKYKEEVWKRRWLIFKTVAAVLNAIIIILIGIYTIYLTDKTNRLEKENEELKKNIELKNK